MQVLSLIHISERKLPPPRAAFREIVQHEPYPVESKARDILQKLKEGGITRFLLLFRGSRSRSEVVATFLAVLELCKARVLHLAGSEKMCIRDSQYSEDSRAQVDLNCVMNELGEIIELQGTGEGRAFTLAEQQELVRLCAKGNRELLKLQKQILG